MAFTFENFNYSGYLKMLGADDATANRELNDEERSSIYSDAVGRMFKEAAQESKNNPFLSTPKERYEYALEETLKMFPDARSAFNIPEERPTEEAFDPEEFRTFVANHEVETEDIGFYLDDYAKTRINNYTKWQFPGLGNMTSKQFKDIFAERNEISEGMTRDDIIQGKFGKGYVDTSLPSSDAKTGYGAAAVHSLRQAKVLGWQTLQTIRDALPGENTESSAWLDRFVDEAKESVEKYNYQSRYPKSLGDTLAEDGFWAAVGKVFTSAVESWATSGVSILTAVASAPLTGGTSVAAQVIGRGLQMISVMSSLQEIGGAREELERQGLYDPDNPIDAVIAGTISASLDHVAAFNAGFRVLAGKGKNVLTATTHGGTVAQGLERAGRQKYWADFTKRISAMGDTFGGRVLRAMGTEGWTEAAQELPAMWAASRKGADYSLSDYLNRTAEAGLVGALMGGGTHVLGTISQSYADSRKSRREDAEGQRNRDALNQTYNEEGMPHVVDQPDIAVREQHEKMFGADAQIFVTENGNTVVAVYGDEIVEVSYDKNQHGEKTDEEKFAFLRDKAQRELLDRVNANRVEMNPGDIITTSTRTTSTSKITVDDPLQPGKKMTVVVEGGNSEAILEELIRRHQDKNDPLVFRKGMRISKKEVGGEVTKESAANYVVNENNIYRGKGRTRFTIGGNDVLSIGTTVSSEQDAKLGEKAEETATDGGYQILKMSADRKKLTLTKDGLIFDVTIENVGGKKLGVGSGNYGIRARVKITDPVTGNNTEYTQLLRQEAAKRDSETGYGDVVNENVDIAVPSSIIRLIDQPGGGKYLSNDDLQDFAERVGGEIVQPGSEESPTNVRRVAINYTDNNGEKKQKILSFYVFSGKKNSEGKSTTTVFVHDGKRFVTNPETVEDFAPLFEQGMENQVGEAVKKFGLSTASGAAKTAKALGFTVYRWRSGQSSENIKEEAYIFEREVDGKTVWIEVYSAGRVEDGARRTTQVYYKVYTSDDDVAYFNRVAAIQDAQTAEDIQRIFGNQFFRTYVYRTSNGTYCTPNGGETTKLEEAYWTHNTDNVPAIFEAVEVLMIHHKDCAKAVVATLASDEKEFVRLAKRYAKAIDMRDGNIEPPTLKLKKTKEQLDREREEKRKENEARKKAEKAQKEEDKKKQEKDEYQKKTEELVNQLRSDQQPALPKKTKTGWSNKSLLFRKERETDANGREHKYIVIRDRNGIEYNRGEYRNDGEMFEVVANMLDNQEEMTPRNFIIPDEDSRKVVDQIKRRAFVDLSDRVENGEGLYLLLVGEKKGDSNTLRLELRRKKDKKKGLSRENTEAIDEAYIVELEYTNDESLYNAYEEILDALNTLDEDSISTLFVTPEDEATEGAVEAFNGAGVSVSEQEEQQQEPEIVPAITPEEQKAAFIKSMEENGSVIRDGRTFIVRKHTSKDAWVVEIREGDKEPDRLELGTREEALDTAYGIATGEVVQGDTVPARKKTRKKSKKAEQQEQQEQQEQRQEQTPKKTTGRKKPTPTEDGIASLNSVDAIKKRITNIVRKISSFDNAIKELGSSGTAPQAAEHKKFEHKKEDFNKAIEEAKESGDLTNLQDTVRRYTKEFFSRFTAYMQYVAEANGINATNGVKPGLLVRSNDTVDNVRERAVRIIRDIDAKLMGKGEDMQSALQKIAKKSDASFFAEISEKIRKNAKDIVVLSIDSENNTVENAVRELSREMAIHNTVAEIVEAKLLSNNRLSELLANEALVVLHTQREARDFIERNTGVDPLYNKSGKIQGFVLKGKVYLVADSTQGKVTGVLLHELGVHFKKMGLRAPRYEALLADLQDRMAAAQAAASREEQLTSEQVELLAAFERAKGAHLDVSDSRFWHEIAAYLVENNADYNEGIIGRIISYFKRFLYNWGLIGAENISYHDMVMFARGSVRSARLSNFNLTYSEIASENDFLNSVFESLNPSVVTDTDRDRDKERKKEEFKKEVEELKEKGRKEGHRAPNGKKSKLVRGTGPHYDERLWAIVRTTAFRNWFGDWLNASEEEKANMILDENGEPLLVFRGENTYEKEEGNVTQGEVRREFMPSRIILEDYSSDAGRHFSHDYDLAFGMINGSGNYPFLRQFTLRRGLVRNGDSNDLRATIYAGFISTKDARLVETEDFFGSSIYSALAKFKTEGILPLEVYNDILDTASEFDSSEIYDYYEERDEHILETFGEGSEELRQLREEFQQELQKDKAAWNKLHDYLKEHHPNLILKYDNMGEAGDIRADYQGKEANWSFAIFDSSRFKDIDNNGLFSREKDVFASVSSSQEMAENDNSPLLSVADNNIGRPVRYAPGVYVQDDGTFNYVEEEMPEGRTTETLLYGVVRANKGARNTELVRNLKTFLSGNTDVRNRAYSYLTSSDVRAEDLRDENIVFALTSRWVLRNEEEARTIPVDESNLYDQTLLALQDAGGTALGTFEVNEWTDEMMASVANAIGGLTNEQPLFSDKPPTTVLAVGGNRFVDQEIFADVDNVIGQNDELVQIADFDEKGRAIITPTTEENSDEQEDGFTYIIDVDPNAKLANGQVAATEGEKRAALRQTIDRLTEKGIGNYTPYDDFYKDDGTTPIFMQTGAQNTGIAQPAANMKEKVDAFLAEALPEHIRERIHIHYDKASAPTILSRAFGVFFPFARGKKMIHVRAWDRTFGQVIATVAHEASHFGWAMWRSPDLSRAIAKMFDMKTLDGRTVKDVMYDTIPRYFHMFGIDGSNLNSVPDPVRVYLTNEFFARMNHSLLGNNTNDIAKDLGVDHKDYLAIKKEVFDAVTEVQTDLVKVLTNVASPDVLAAFTRDITEMTMGTTIGRGVDAYYTTQNWDNGSGKMVKRGTVHIYVNDYGQSRKEVREGRLGTQIAKTKEVIDKWETRFGGVGRAFAYFVLQNFPMNNGFRGFGKDGDFWYIPGLHVEGSKLGEQIATSRAAVMIGHVMRKVSEEIGGELRRKYDAYSDLEAAMRDRHFDPNILTGKAQQPGQAPLTYKQVIEDLGLGNDAELVRKAEMADASIMWCRNQILSNAIAIRRTIMEQADALAERMRAAFPAEPDLDVNEYIDRMYSNMTEMASKISGDWTHRMYRAYSEEGYLELSQMLNYLNVNPSTGRLRLKEEQELAEREIAKLNALKSKPVDQGGITMEHYREAIEKPQKIVKLAYRLDELEAYVKQRIGIKRAISKAENYPSLVLETMRREIQEIMMQSRKHYSGAMGNDHLNTIPSMMGRKLDPSIEVDYHYMNFLDPETNVLKTLLHSVDQQNKILMKLTFNRELGEHILDTGMGNFKELFGGKRSSSEIGFLEKGSFLQYIAIDPLFQEALEKEYNIQKSLRETVWGGVIDSWKANNTIYSFKLGMSNYIGNISLLAAGGHFFRWGNMKVGSGIAWEQWKERLGFSDGKWEGNAGKIMELMRKHHLIGGTVSDTRMIVGQTGVHEKVLHSVFQGLREIDAIGFMGQRQMENTVKRILEKFRQFYAFGDEWIKPIIFLNNYNVALAKYEAGLLDSEDAAAREAAEQTMRETTTWEMTSRMARELSARSIRIFTPDFVMHNFQMLRILAANFVREREISRELATLGDKNSLDEKRKAYYDELIDERVRRRIGGAFTLSTYTSLMVTGMGVIPFLTNMLIAALGGDAGDDDDERREKFEKNPDAKHGFNMREWDGAVRVANWMTGGNNLHAPFIRDKWNMYTWNYVRSNAMLTHAIPHPPNENWKPSDMVFQMFANLMDLNSGTMTQELINNALGRDKWGKEIGWEAGWLKIVDRAMIPGTLRQMLGVTVGYPQTDTLYHTGREIKIPELAGITVNKYDMRDVANRLGYFLKEKESDQRNYRRGNFVSALEKGRALSDGEIVNLVRDMKEYNRYEKGKADYLLVGLREFGLTEKELKQYLTTSRKGGSALLGQEKTDRYLRGENILDTGLIEHLGNKRKNLIKSQQELRMTKEELATVLQNYDKVIRIYTQALRAQ